MARRGIYKRGNIYWICYADLSGKIIRKSARTDSYREAETQLIGEQKAVREGKLTDAIKIKNHSFVELKDKYVSWMQGRHKSAESKEYRINKLVEHLGELSLRRFNTLIVEQYQTKLLQDD